MPETSVDEHRYASPREDQIGSCSRAAQRSVVDEVAKAPSMGGATDGPLWPSVTSALPFHAASCLSIEGCRVGTSHDLFSGVGLSEE
jgi:hypothetical protein